MDESIEKSGIIEDYFPIHNVISVDIQILTKLRYKYGTNWRENGV